MMHLKKLEKLNKILLNKDFQKDRKNKFKNYKKFNITLSNIE